MVVAARVSVKDKEILKAAHRTTTTTTTKTEESRRQKKLNIIGLVSLFIGHCKGYSCS